MALVYDVSVIGGDKVRRFMRGVEQEAKASAARLERAGRGGRDVTGRKFGRGADGLGGLAAVGKVAAREEMARHRLLMGNAAPERAAVPGGVPATGRGRAGRNLLVGGAALAGGVGAFTALQDEIEVRKRASVLAGKSGAPRSPPPR